MKINKSIITFVFLLFATAFMAQEGSTDKKTSKISKATFEVSGVCGMCQKRIEKAALIKGVKMAEWDKNTQIITVLFNNTKTSLESISKSIAEAGHDTDTNKATEETYQSLNACCAYRDGIEVH